MLKMNLHIIACILTVHELFILKCGYLQSISTQLIRMAIFVLTSPNYTFQMPRADHYNCNSVSCARHPLHSLPLPSPPNTLQPPFMTQTLLPPTGVCLSSCMIFDEVTSLSPLIITVPHLPYNIAVRSDLGFPNTSRSANHSSPCQSRD